MSLWDSFKKKVNETWSGLDFWDEEENRKQREQFAQQRQQKPAPSGSSRIAQPQQVQQTQISQPQQSYEPTPIAQPKPVQRRELKVGMEGPLQPKSKEMPKYQEGWRGVFERAGDMFEANSPQDQYKREQAGQPTLYEDQKGDTAWEQIKSDPKLVANPIKAEQAVREEVLQPIAQGPIQVAKDVWSLKDAPGDIKDSMNQWKEQKDEVIKQQEQLDEYKEQIEQARNSVGNTPEIEAAVKQLEDAQVQIDEANKQLEDNKLTPWSMGKGLVKGTWEDITGAFITSDAALKQAKERGLDVEDPWQARAALASYAVFGLADVTKGGGKLIKTSKALSKTDDFSRIAKHLDDLGLDTSTRQFDDLIETISKQTDSKDIERTIGKTLDDVYKPSQTGLDDVTPDEELLARQMTGQEAMPPQTPDSPYPRPETKPGAQSISELMPDIANRKAATESMDDMLSKKYGVQPQTVRRLRNSYGDDATRNLLARNSDATNIRNRDAFITSQAKKQLGPLKTGFREAVDAELAAGATPEDIGQAGRTTNPTQRKLEISKELNQIAQEMKRFRKGSEPYAELELRAERLTKELDTPVRSPADNKIIRAEINEQLGEVLEEMKKFDVDSVPYKRLQGERDRLVGELKAAYDAEDMIKIGGEAVSKKNGEVLEDIVDPVVMLKEASNIEAVDASRRAIKKNINELFSAVDSKKIQREVYDYERGVIDEVSPTTRAFMEKLDKIYEELSPESVRYKPDGSKRHEYYLPELHKYHEAPSSDGAFLSEIDKHFGFGKKREEKIAFEDLADPEVALDHYVDQMTYHHKSDIIEAAEYQGYKAPEKYVQTKQKLAKEMAESVDKEFQKAQRKAGEGTGRTVKIARKTDEKVLDRIQNNFDESGDPDAVIKRVNSGAPVAGNLRTNREFLKRIDIDPETGTLYDATLSRYERAQGMAVSHFDEAMQTDNFTNAIYQKYDDMYYNGLAPTRNSGGQAPLEAVMSKDKYDEMVLNHARRAERTGSPLHLAQLERKLAVEKAIHHAERLRFTDKKIQKTFNDEMAYMLKEGRRVKSLAEKATNEAASAIHVGLLGLKPRSAALNLTELARVYGDVTGKEGLASFKQTLKTTTPSKVRRKLSDYGVTDDIIADATEDVVKYDRGKNPVTRGYRRVQEGVMKPFQATENFKDYALLTALEEKYKYISDPAQKRLAVLDDFNRSAYKYGHGGSVRAVQRSKLARLGLQFGQYTMKDLGYLGERAARGDYAFLAKTLGTKGAMAVPMYLVFGASVMQTLGLSDYRGGPSISMVNELFTQIGYENNRVENEGGEFNWDNVRNGVAQQGAGMVVPAGDFLINKIGIQELSDMTKDLPIFRDDNVIADNRRGYNESHDGRARFANPREGDLWEQAKRWLGGVYNTEEAQKYFGNSPFDLDLYNIAKYEPNADDRQFPVNSNYQEKIEGTDDNKEIRRLIEGSREQQAVKEQFFEDNPELEGVYRDMTRAELNPETGKRESDVLSPEKWRKVASDQSLTVYNFLKQRAEMNNEEFGYEIDPIYKLDDDNRIREILSQRAMPTGDDVERQEILRSTTDWFPKFEEAENEYYSSFDDKDFDEDSDFGSSERKAAWQAVSDLESQLYDNRPKFVDQYYTLKEQDPDAASEFYKNNADRLSSYFDNYRKKRLKYINMKRALEGYDPIDDDTFNNVTFGYENDERKVQNELYYKLGGGYGSGGGNVYAKRGDFGQKRALDLPSGKIKVDKVKVGKKYEPKTVKIKRNKRRS